MSNKPTLHLMIGIPCSGKSTYTETLLLENKNIVLLESDVIRESLVGGLQGVENTTLVFKNMLSQTVENLRAGRNVIYDATNVSYKDRRGLLNSIPKDTYVIGHVMVTPWETCVERNAKRERPVPHKAMVKMYKRFNFPVLREGFNEILFHTTEEEENVVDMLPTSLSTFVDAIKGKQDKEFYENRAELEAYLFVTYGFFDPDVEGLIYDVPQDNSHHTLTISAHTTKAFMALELVPKYPHNESIKVAMFFHDMGKGFTKEFKNYKGQPTEEAHYYNHENISAYKAMVFTVYANKLLPEDNQFNVSRICTLVQNHMKLYGHAGVGKRWKKLLSAEIINELRIINRADRLGK